MIRPLSTLPALFALSMAAQGTSPPDNPIPPEAAAMTNPVHQTPESQARAKAMFSLDCSLCHGVHGDGKGDIVADMKLTMNDWTVSSSPLNTMKDGEIFYVIKNGKGKMPPEAGRAKDSEFWSMVIYVRSLAKK